MACCNPVPPLVKQNLQTLHMIIFNARNKPLESLPASGFEVSCFPVKVHAASAGWTRAVAIFTE